MQYVFVQIFQVIKSKQQYTPRTLILSVQYPQEPTNSNITFFENCKPE